MGPIGFLVATSQSRAPVSRGLAVGSQRPSGLLTLSKAVDFVCLVSLSASDFGGTFGFMMHQVRTIRSRPTVTILTPSGENPTLFSPQGQGNGSPISWHVRESQRRAILSTAPPPVTIKRPSELNSAA